MLKILLIASIPLSFIGGYFVGRKKFKKLWEKNLDLDIENTNLKEKIDKLEIINNDYEKCLLDVRDLIKDKHMCDKIEVLNIFKTLIDKHDIDEIIGWNHSSD